MPIITRLDKDVPARKTYNPIRFDESEPVLILERGINMEHDPTTTTGSTQNMQTSTQESSQDTSVVGEAPVP